MVLLTKSEVSPPPKFRRRLMWCVPLGAGAVCLLLACVPLLVSPAAVITAWLSWMARSLPVYVLCVEERPEETLQLVTKPDIMQVSSEGSAVEGFLTVPLYPVVLSVWLFNITNAASFQDGQDNKLKVEQVGPFTYRETRYNDNFTVDMAAGVMRFTARSHVHFAPELSSAHADDVTLTLPNLAMLGTATVMSSQNYWTRTGFNVLAHQLDSQPTVTVNASTYLWGYSDPLLTLVHNLIPGYIDFEKIGLLDKFFNESNHLEISARNHDKFMIKKRNGQTKLPMGSLNSVDNCKLCDDFVNSYEAFGYPCSVVTPETPINIYKNGLCKIVPTEFHKKVVYESGVEGLIFNLSDRFFSLDHNATNNGMLDLRDCFYGIPLTISKPHFLGVDPELYERVEGIPEPDPTKLSYFIIEPMIAMELESAVRLQINLVLPDLSFCSRASRYSRMVVPVAYIEFIQPPLPGHTYDSLHLLYVTAPIITWTAMALLVFTGLALISHPVILYLMHKHLTTEKVIVVSTQEPLLQSQVKHVFKQ